jgi:hypothetical protein
MTEVINENFDKVLKEIELLLSKTLFISFDLEFSGLNEE